MSDKVFDRLTLLAADLCKTVTNDGEDPLCFCDVAPGEGVAHDYGFGDSCGDAQGMAWVRLMQEYPAVTPGEPSLANCGTLRGIEVEVGLLRPYFIQEEGITSEIAVEAVRGQYEDKAMLRKVILCCEAFGKKDLILGTYVPVGPLGGIFGGIYQFVAVV